jgi:4'-phosphopantetheinyl transferase
MSQVIDSNSPLPPCWEHPKIVPSLGDGEVHLWQADLGGEAAQVQRYAQWLSLDEQERAQRFRFEQHRRRFICARGILRSLLSQYLNHHSPENPISAAAIQLSYDAHGKPQLASLSDILPLHFNLSHSGDLALYGFSLHVPLGIDVEFLRSVSDVAQLAHRFFTPNECDAIDHSPPEQQQALFFQTWTRKEAILKATGIGLVGLQDAEVTVHPEEPAQWVGQPDWTLHSFVPKTGYAGAIAIPHLQPRLRYFQVMNL